MANDLGNSYGQGQFDRTSNNSNSAYSSAIAWCICTLWLLSSGEREMQWSRSQSRIVPHHGTATSWVIAGIAARSIIYDHIME